MLIKRKEICIKINEEYLDQKKCNQKISFIKLDVFIFITQNNFLNLDLIT
jgi:hypothetical protein